MAATILTSAAGKLNIEKAWSYSQEQILEWLKGVRKSPPQYGITKVDRNRIAQTVGPKSKTMSHSFAIDYMKHLVKTQRITNPYFMGEDEDGNIDYRDYDAVLDGKQLPVRTLFDVLGWILSVTAKPDGGKATQNNFYLPLLALFGKWCWALLPDKTSQPNMIHISWMEKPEVEENVVIIGATPGGDECYWSGEKEVYHEKEPQTEESRKKLKSIPSNEKINWSYEGHRGKDVVGSRQQMLRDLRVPVPPGDEENLVQVGKKDPAHKNKLLTHVNRDGELVDDTDETAYTVGSSAYGVCAETFSYIWMGQHMRDHDIPLINGFALDTTKVDFADMTTFDPAKLENAFREPCRNSCQKIMPHFKGKFLFKLERMEPLSNGTQPVEKKVNSRKKAKAKAKAKKSEKDNDDEQSGDGL